MISTRDRTLISPSTHRIKTHCNSNSPPLPIDPPGGVVRLYLLNPRLQTDRGVLFFIIPIHIGTPIPKWVTSWWGASMAVPAVVFVQKHHRMNEPTAKQHKGKQTKIGNNPKSTVTPLFAECLCDVERGQGVESIAFTAMVTNPHPINDNRQIQ